MGGSLSIQEGADFLTLQNVSKSFGGVKALDHVSFTVSKGMVVGIIGPNGSGKTSLVNAITGFVQPDPGQIQFKGKNIAGVAPHRISQLGIARTFQTARPFHRLVSFKNLIVPLFSSRSRRYTEGGRWGDRDGVCLDLMEEVGFERDSAVPYKPASALPHGYLRRLELARCLALRAELVITDELFSGLSSSEVATMIPLIEKLHLSGVTLVMVEHRLRELFKVAENVLVMEQGRKITEGPPKEIVRDAKVREMYLGVEL